jgi:hypothetical protein
MLRMLYRLVGLNQPLIVSYTDLPHHQAGAVLHGVLFALLCALAIEQLSNLSWNSGQIVRGGNATNALYGNCVKSVDVHHSTVVVTSLESEQSCSSTAITRHPRNKLVACVEDLRLMRCRPMKCWMSHGSTLFVGYIWVDT